MAIREARGALELQGKLTGELFERHAHVHAVTLTPEAIEQLHETVERMSDFAEYRKTLKPAHPLLEGEAALVGYHSESDRRS